MLNTCHAFKAMIFFVACCFVVVVPIKAQNASGMSLYVTNCNDEANCTKQSIIRFVFRDGNVVLNEVVAELPREKSDFEFRPKIIANRYIVSSLGEVLDLALEPLVALGSEDDFLHFGAS